MMKKTEIKNRLPKNAEIASLDFLDRKERFTKEYLEQRCIEDAKKVKVKGKVKAKTDELRKKAFEEWYDNYLEMMLPSVGGKK